MRRRVGAAATRLQVGQGAGSQRQMAAHDRGQRVQHLTIGPGRLYIGLAQQRSQPVDVSAQGREFGVGRDQCGQVFGATGTD